jgi:hypothetical protein
MIPTMMMMPFNFHDEKEGEKTKCRRLSRPDKFNQARKRVGGIRNWSMIIIDLF